MKGGREPKLLMGRRAEIRGTSPAVPRRACPAASKLLDESEAHTRASRYRTGQGLGRGYPNSARRKPQSVERHVVGFRPTPWRPASWCLADGATHRDKTPGPRVEAVVSRLAHTGAKASPGLFPAGRAGGSENLRDIQHTIRDDFWYAELA